MGSKFHQQLLFFSSLDLTVHACFFFSLLPLITSLIIPQSHDGLPLRGKVFILVSSPAHSLYARKKFIIRAQAAKNFQSAFPAANRLGLASRVRPHQISFRGGNSKDFTCKFATCITFLGRWPSDSKIHSASASQNKMQGWAQKAKF